MSELKPCRLCGKRAIIERWSSGGPMYMAKCSNPDCFENYPGAIVSRKLLTSGTKNLKRKETPMNEPMAPAELAEIEGAVRGGDAGPVGGYAEGQHCKKHGD